MRPTMRRGLQIALVLGGAIFCSAQAQADDTTGLDSVLGGNQAVVVIEAPVTVSGNAVSVIGDSSSADSDTSATSGSGHSDGAGTSSTSGEDSVAGGNQVAAPVGAPVTVSGNAVSVIGDSKSSDSEASVETGSDADAESESTTSGEDSIGGGTQVVSPADITVTVGGNAVSVIGDSHSEGSTTAVTGGGTGTGDASTSGEDSLLGGNQVLAPITAPVTVGGNAVSVIGDSHSEASSTGVTSGGEGSGTGDASTSGEDSLLGGNQVMAPITAPVTVGGNAVSVVGDSTTEGGTVSPSGQHTPVDPTDLVDPTHPAGPTHPTQPSVPVGPATPTEPSIPGIVDDASRDGAVGAATTTQVSTLATAAPAASALAQTGAMTGTVLLGALLLLLLGVALLTLSRRRITTTA